MISLAFTMGLLYSLFVGRSTGVEHKKYVEELSKPDTNVYACPATIDKAKLGEICAECGIDKASVKFILINKIDMPAKAICWANVIEINPFFCRAFSSNGLIWPNKELPEIVGNASPELHYWIVKHELGHLHNNDTKHSVEECMSIAFLSMFSAGVARGLLSKHLGDMWGTVGAFVTFSVCRDGLMALHNRFIKQKYEKEADCFAAQYRSSAQIKAAADWFESQQIESDTHLDKELAPALRPVQDLVIFILIQLTVIERHICEGYYVKGVSAIGRW